MEKVQKRLYDLDPPYHGSVPGIVKTFTYVNDTTRPNSKYAPLYDFLKDYPKNKVTLSFQEIEEIIGAPLPKSATGMRSRTWWANSISQSYARCWMNAGWNVDTVKEYSGKVVFWRKKRPFGY